MQSAKIRCNMWSVLGALKTRRLSTTIEARRRHVLFECWKPVQSAKIRCNMWSVLGALKTRRLSKTMASRPFVT